MELYQKSCKEITATLLEAEQISSYIEKVDQWQVTEKNTIEKEFLFSNFKEALTFVNKVGDLAEEEDHHPDIILSYGKVRVSLTTHKVGGLSEKDFILAAKIDNLI